MANQLKEEMPNLSKEEYKQRQNALYQEFIKTKQDFEQEIEDSIKLAVGVITKEKNLGSITNKNSDNDYVQQVV